MKIALCGRLRSGKDVFANQLIDDYGFQGFKFSSGITEIIQRYFPEDISQKRKMREHYQRIGQGMRMLDSKVWINNTDRQINMHLEIFGEDSDILVSDLRQNNEYKYLKENGFIIIKIEADEQVRISRAMSINDTFHNSALRHETELSVDGIAEDYLVTNNSTLEDFERKIDEVMLDIIVKELKRNRKY